MAKTNIIPPILSDNDIQRFWRNVDKSPGFGPSGDCWRWMQKPNEWGYGRLFYTAGGARSYIRTHRLSFFLTTQKWPVGLVLHSCDMPLCVNPNHLREGTCQDNSDDAIQRGRTRRGIKNHNAKMDENTIREIRALYPGIGTRKLAKRFSLCRSVVRRIVARKTWKHI